MTVTSRTRQSVPSIVCERTHIQHYVYLPRFWESGNTSITLPLFHVETYLNKAGRFVDEYGEQGILLPMAAD